MGIGVQIGFILNVLSENFANTLRVFPCVRRRFRFNKDISGKVVVITGANTGIGKVTAKELATRGAKVIIGCRDVDKGNKVVEEIKGENSNSDIRVIKLDLSSLASVRKFAQQVNQEESNIDVLINNAGVMMTPKWQTEDGFEMQFGTNHLGHFLLTLLLMDKLKASPNARIVNLSSLGYMLGVMDFDDINLDAPGKYTPTKAYSNSKLANVLFTRELARRLKDTNIKAYAVHPGIVQTELARHMTGDGCLKTVFNIFGFAFSKTPYLGAQTSLYCAFDESLANESGHYYRNCRRKNLASHATDDVAAKKLWDLSCDLVNVEENLRLN